jgi:hypothetical protein
VEPLGPGRFPLLASPGFVEGVAAGDELELVPIDRVGLGLGVLVNPST